MERVTIFLNSLGVNTPESVKAIRSQLSQISMSSPEVDQNTVNLYILVGNDPVIAIDNLGLDCSSAPPLSANCAACDAYGSGSYMGASFQMLLQMCWRQSVVAKSPRLFSV